MRPNLNNLSGEKEALSLLELNTRIRGALSRAFPKTCWVRAEMSDVRVNTSSGHCYLEFVEKNVQTGQLVAKVRGSIWAKTFRMLKPYFEMETGQMFASGLKVLVKVSVEFHELYGLSLTVLDIDPAYTLGDMVRKRMEIIRQLQEEGVFTLNKELPFPLLPRRIAIITSPTAVFSENYYDNYNAEDDAAGTECAGGSVKYDRENYIFDIKNDSSGGDYVKLWHIILDHPLYHNSVLRQPLKNMRVVCLDETHAEYIRKYYSHIKEVIVMPLPADTAKSLVPYNERSRDVLFT